MRAYFIVSVLPPLCPRGHNVDDAVFVEVVAAAKKVAEGGLRKSEMDPIRAECSDIPSAAPYSHLELKIGDLAAAGAAGCPVSYRSPLRGVM